MIYYLNSSDPDNYGTIKFGTFIRGFTDHLKYRIVNFTTTGSFSNTTSGDYVIVNGEKFLFRDKEDYNIHTLEEEINLVLVGSHVTCKIDDGHLVYTAEEEFVINSWTHRAGLIMGFYNSGGEIHSYEDEG
jgi:hypothetical protein